MRLDHEWSKRDSCPCHKDNTNLFKTIMILCTNCLRRKKNILFFIGMALLFPVFATFPMPFCIFSIYRHLHYVLGMRWLGVLVTVDRL